MSLYLSVDVFQWVDNLQGQVVGDFVTESVFPYNNKETNFDFQNIRTAMSN